MRSGRRAIAIAAALLAAGCAPPAPQTPILVDTTTPLARGIDSLRALGLAEQAIPLAEQRDRDLAGAPAWRRADAARTVRTLRRIAALPPAAQAELARADAATTQAESLAAADDPQGAIRLIEQQRSVRARWLGADHAETAASTSALARALSGSGDVTRAIALDREALGVRRRVLGDRHPDVAASLDQLGADLKTAGGSREESMALYRGALALRRDLLGADSPEAIETLLHIGNLHRLRQQPDSALAVFQGVLDLARRSDRVDAAQTANVLFSMAMTVTPRGRWAEAEPWLREAVARGRRLGPAGTSLLARALGAHGLVLRHLHRQAEAESTLVESVRLFEDMRRQAPPGWSRAVLFPLVSYDFLAAVQLERGHEREAWLSVEGGLARALLEDLAASGAVDTTGWWDDALGQVQRALDDDAALIGWLTFRAGATTEEYPFWCWCIRKRGPVTWRRVDAPPRGPRAAADVHLDRMRRELVRAASWPLRVSDGPGMQQLARDAYALRIAPLEPALRGVRRLVVVSPDLLHGTPVEAMLDSTFTYLGDRFVVSYAPSALLYARSRASETGRRAPARWRALLVGDPGLGAARREVEALATLLPAPTVLLGADASARSLARLADDDALGAYQLIHFATHATVDQTLEGESALVLGDAGRIAAPELARHWRLDADLVALAACETVVGPASKTEGFLGLQQALLAVGTRHLLVSAWRVDDRATEMLVGRFYERLLADPRGAAGAADALSEARRWLRAWRAPDGSRPFAHPVYWAGFVLVDGGLGGRRPPHAAAANSR